MSDNGYIITELRIEETPSKEYLTAFNETIAGIDILWAEILGTVRSSQGFTETIPRLMECFSPFLRMQYTEKLKRLLVSFTERATLLQFVPAKYHASLLPVTPEEIWATVALVRGYEPDFRHCGLSLDEIERLIISKLPKKEPPKPKDGYVYLIQDISVTGYCKIGRAKYPKERFKRFEVSLPFEFKVLHTIECDDYAKAESELHDKFRSKRQNGEWFKLSKDDIKWFKSIEKM